MTRPPGKSGRALLAALSFAFLARGAVAAGVSLLALAEKYKGAAVEKLRAARGTEGASQVARATEFLKLARKLLLKHPEPLPQKGMDELADVNALIYWARAKLPPDAAVGVKVPALLNPNNKPRVACALEYLARAREYAANDPDHHFMIAVRYAEVAGRFKGTEASRQARPLAVRHERLASGEPGAARPTTEGPREPAPALPPSITSTPPEIAIIDMEYTHTIRAAGSPAPNFTVEGLPDWLRFDGKDTISGTPFARHRGMTGGIAVAASNGAGTDSREFRIKVRLGDPFGYRLGGARRCAALKNGGNERSEASVDAALRWLARNQGPGGNWAIKRWGGEYEKECTVGLTGLALLAFLAAGHTEGTGEHVETVRKAVAYLIGRQAANGALGKNLPVKTKTGGGYNHGIAGLALAEAYGMEKIPRTGRAAQKAVHYSVRVHQIPGSGWRYTPRDKSCDTSVTGWFVVQLKSAQVAGLKVDPRGYQGAVAWLDKVTEKPNRLKGRHGGRASYREIHGPTPIMTAVAMLSRQSMGWRRNQPVLVGGAKYLSQNLPEWNTDKPWMFYYWYHGTQVMFQMGGQHWRRWNAALRDMLIAHQIRKPGDTRLDGSWDPANDGKYAGRVYSTALCCMCLEVYYRYRNLYE